MAAGHGPDTDQRSRGTGYAIEEHDVEEQHTRTVVCLHTGLPEFAMKRLPGHTRVAEVHGGNVRRTTERLGAAMSLPVGQQRVLDDIEGALQASEPRLASMYAIFTRLTKNETRPRREELSAACIRLGWLRCLSVRRVIRAMTPRNWGPVPRAIVLAQIITVLAALGVLLGLTAHTVRGACTGGLGVHPALTHTRAGCRDQMGSLDFPIAK